MTLLAQITATAIDPALALLPAGMDSPAARRMLLAIGLQESRLTHRYQVLNGGGKGPARGLWQFERGGGVVGVISHPATMKLASALCARRGVDAIDSAVIHASLEFDDVLAAGFARLLLWSDPKALPGLDASPDETWACYVRSWRPGRPHRSTWNDFHAQALEAV